MGINVVILLLVYATGREKIVAIRQGNSMPGKKLVRHISTRFILVKYTKGKDNAVIFLTLNL